MNYKKSTIVAFIVLSFVFVFLCLLIPKTMALGQLDKASPSSEHSLAALDSSSGTNSIALSNCPNAIVLGIKRHKKTKTKDNTINATIVLFL